MEIKEIKGNTYCIDTGMTYILFYKINNEKIIMLDTGWAKERKGIEELLEKSNLKIFGIINSHAHVDHLGNNAYFKENLNNMIVFDYIVNNIDRHLKNFGFLEKDNVVRFAPIYDNGLALESHLDDDEMESEDIQDLLLDSDYTKCFDTSNRRQLDLITSHTLKIDIDFESVVNKYSKYFSEKRIKFILDLLKQRIEEVKKCCFQNQK